MSYQIKACYLITDHETYDDDDVYHYYHYYGMMDN